MTEAPASFANRLRSCRGVLVDSNVLLDVATNDPVWGSWSAEALAVCAEFSALVINAIVYAEVSVGFSTIEALDASLPRNLYQRAPLPFEAGFLAVRPLSAIAGAADLELCPA